MMNSQSRADRVREILNETDGSSAIEALVDETEKQASVERILMIALPPPPPEAVLLFRLLRQLKVKALILQQVAVANGMKKSPVCSACGLRH